MSTSEKYSLLRSLSLSLVRSRNWPFTRNYNTLKSIFKRTVLQSNMIIKFHATNCDDKIWILISCRTNLIKPNQPKVWIKIFLKCSKTYMLSAKKKDKRDRRGGAPKKSSGILTHCAHTWLRSTPALQFLIAYAIILDFSCKLFGCR